VSAYTAPMQIGLHPTHHLITLCGIALLTTLTSGCYTPTGKYYGRTAAFFVEQPCYASTCSYPAYTPDLIAIETPTYVRSTPFYPAIWRQDENHAKLNGCEMHAPYHRRHEVAGISHWQQGEQYANRSWSDQKPISQFTPTPRWPVMPLAGHTSQRRPSLVNN
jgi:hypothetical protein